MRIAGRSRRLAIGIICPFPSSGGERWAAGRVGAAQGQGVDVGEAVTEKEGQVGGRDRGVVDVLRRLGSRWCYRWD